MEIIIIDKHPILRTGLCQVLKCHFQQAVISDFDSIFSFHDSCPGQFPDLIIVGFKHTQENDNFIGIRKVKKWFPAASIIVYDDHRDHTMVARYFKAGIKGYLTRQSSLSDVIECVEKVSNRKLYITLGVLEVLLTGSPLNQIKLPGKGATNLTFRENEIANYISMGMSTSWIAQKLELKSSTISTFKSKIFKKFNVDNVVELIDAMK